MRFTAIIKATPESEAGVRPSERLLRETGNFNEERVRAGVMLAGEWLPRLDRVARRATFSVPRAVRRESFLMSSLSH